MSDDIPEGELMTVDVDGASVVVARVEGALYALDNCCSHDMSPFDAAETEGFDLCCPRHEGRFDVRTGKATRFPAVWPIGTWQVCEENGRILVGREPATKGA
jgi:nitrite reductase/ring-hydroxylating ferredoxin subunit